MIFQHLALFPHLSVAENIAFGLEMKKVPRAIIRDRVKSTLELVRLPDFGSRRIDALSGGQKQRVALARALVNEPDVLLLDEPLGALDLRLRLQMQDELRRLHQATRKTFVFVTHDQTEGMTMSDRIAIMSNGEILQVGTPRQVYESPERQFVAEFLGSSNLLVGRIKHIDSTGVGTVGVSGVDIACYIPPNLEVGRKVSIVLRYEKIEVLPSSVEATRGDLLGVLLSEVFMGSAIRYEIQVNPHLNLIGDVANSGKATTNFVPGSQVRLRWQIADPVILTD